MVWEGTRLGEEVIPEASDLPLTGADQSRVPPALRSANSPTDDEDSTARQKTD